MPNRKIRTRVRVAADPVKHSRRRFRHLIGDTYPYLVKFAIALGFIALLWILLGRTNNLLPLE